MSIYFPSQKQYSYFSCKSRESAEKLNSSTKYKSRCLPHNDPSSARPTGKTRWDNFVIWLRNNIEPKLSSVRIPVMHLVYKMLICVVAFFWISSIHRYLLLDQSYFETKYRVTLLNVRSDCVNEKGRKTTSRNQRGTN